MTEVPKEFLCPITLSLMKDPVIMPDGQTYEREAIKKALEDNSYSPVTKKPMNIKDATPNYALKSMIEKYLNGGETPLKIEQPQKVDLNIQTKIKTFKAEVIDDPENLKEVFINISIEPEKNEDKMSLITFNDEADLCLEATDVNDFGKNTIFDEIEKMYASGCTNI